MAKKTYVGVNNIAQNVSKMYVGVNGVARRVKNAYVGVNGVARLVYENANVYISHMFASMVGQPFKIYNGGTLVLDATFPSEDVPYGWQCEQTGTYTLKTSDNTCETQFTVSNLNGVTNVYWYATPYRKTFAAATDAEIDEMIESADKTGLNLYDDCAWRVGQEHTVSLSAIPSSGTYNGTSFSVGESQPAQTATLVLAHKGGYQLASAVKGDDGVTSRTECSFAVAHKQMMEEWGYLHGTRPYPGWSVTDRRYWCNSNYMNALPTNLKNVIKQVAVYWARNYDSSLLNFNYDYVFIPTLKELLGSSSNAYNSNAETTAIMQSNNIFQLTYFNTASNRVIIPTKHYYYQESRIIDTVVGRSVSGEPRYAASVQYYVSAYLSTDSALGNDIGLYTHLNGAFIESDSTSRNRLCILPIFCI